MKAQARSGLGLGVLAMELLEWLEQMLLVLRPDAQPGIRHAEGDLVPSRAGRARDLEADTTHARELDRIGREIDEDLDQRAPVRPDLDRLLAYRYSEREPLPLGGMPQRGRDLLQHLRRLDRLDRQLGFSRLDLGQVQEVVDQGEQ